MKNVTKTRINRSFAAAILGSALFCSLFTGCIWEVSFPEESTGKVSVQATTAAGTTAVQTSAGSTERPYGVKLKADPSILVTCRSERVVDGDTIIVHDPDNNRLRVRLTGINSPESVAEDESRNTEEGRVASKFMKELMKDIDTVYLEYDEGRTDQYGRTLAYVWIKNGSDYIMLNEVMLAAGHAKPVYIKPNLRYADDFRKYEKKSHE